MPKPSKIVSIQKQTNKARLIASDTQVQRIIIGLGDQRIAYDFHVRTTHLPAAIGDRPAAILAMKKVSKKEPA